MSASASRADNPQSGHQCLLRANTDLMLGYLMIDLSNSISGGWISVIEGCAVGSGKPARLELIHQISPWYSGCTTGSRRVRILRYTKDAAQPLIAMGYQ